MTFYDNPFETSIQCDEVSPEVSSDEQAEIFQMLAEEHAAFEASGQWSADLAQQQFEQEQDEQKDWLKGYSNHKTGKTYNGLDV